MPFFIQERHRRSCCEAHIMRSMIKFLCALLQAAGGISDAGLNPASGIKIINISFQAYLLMQLPALHRPLYPLLPVSPLYMPYVCFHHLQGFLA